MKLRLYAMITEVLIEMESFVNVVFYRLVQKNSGINKKLLMTIAATKTMLQFLTKVAEPLCQLDQATKEQLQFWKQKRKRTRMHKHYLKGHRK